MQSSDPDQKNKEPLNQKIENFPIHTMQKDLTDLENLKQEISRPQTDPVKTFAAPRPENLTPTQKTSPFLGANLPKMAQPALTPATPRPTFSPVPSKPTTPTPIAPRPQIPQITSAFPEKETGNSQSGIGKSLVITFAILILAIIAGGGYYFWATRQNTDEEITATPDITSENEELTEIAVEQEIPAENQEAVRELEPVAVPDEFSLDKPNYLSIGDASDAIAIQSIIDQYGVRVAATTANTPVEFIVTDQNNNPVDLQVFLQKMGIAFSLETVNQLGNVFSLFLYRNSIGGNDYRTGLAIDIESEAALKESFGREESALIEKLRPLMILGFDQSPIDPIFKSSTYKDVNIRFRNILSDGGLSVDYAFYNNQLLIGTTQNTLRAIIDKKSGL